jgi:hypothetical protein
MTNYPITPPPELVQQWVRMLEFLPDKQVFSEAAQWGADQELDACCEWVEREIGHGSQWNAHLHSARRPKSPSLKEQALAELEILRGDANAHGLGFDAPAIRRALEALLND